MPFLIKTKMTNKKTSISLTLLISISLGTVSINAQSEEPVQRALDIRLEGQQESIQIQQEIDQLAEQKLTMVQEYQQSTVQIGDLRVYNDQLEKLVENQRENLASFDRQLQNAKEAQRTIVPMLLKMVKVLEKFIQLDTPFLEQERTMRVEALKDMLEDPAVTTSEKYRRILEAYQIETDYGRTLESSTAEIQLNGETKSVELLRVGRVALLFASFDGTESGLWNKETKQWEVLSHDYNTSINRGLRIARKESPPDLIKIPLKLEKLLTKQNRPVGGEK